jgi:thiamine biosynthesis protein ThiS
MHIRLNGTIREVVDGLTVSGLLDELSLGPHQVLVLVNMNIVRREQYSDLVLMPGDAVEIPTFLSGG